MELEELKNNWQTVSEKLNRQELLHENMVRKIINSKTDRLLNRLSNYEWLDLVVAILCLPLPLLLLKDNFSIKQIVIVFFFIAMILFSICCQVWKIWVLSRIDFNKDVAFNIKLVNKFNIHIKREMMQTYLVFPVIFLLVGEFVWNTLALLSTVRIVFIFAILVAAVVFCIWQYRKLYVRNIASILKSLEELKDLDER